MILEQFPWMEKGKYAREKATAVISLTFLVLGIPFLTNVSQNTKENSSYVPSLSSLC